MKFMILLLLALKTPPEIKKSEIVRVESSGLTFTFYFKDALPQKRVVYSDATKNELVLEFSNTVIDYANYTGLASGLCVPLASGGDICILHEAKGDQFLFKFELREKKIKGYQWIDGINNVTFEIVAEKSSKTLGGVYELIYEYADQKAYDRINEVIREQDLALFSQEEVAGLHYFSGWAYFQDGKYLNALEAFKAAKELDYKDDGLNDYIVKASKYLEGPPVPAVKIASDSVSELVSVVHKNDSAVKGREMVVFEVVGAKADYSISRVDPTTVRLVLENVDITKVSHLNDDTNEDNSYTYELNDNKGEVLIRQDGGNGVVLFKFARGVKNTTPAVMLSPSNGNHKLIHPFFWESSTTPVRPVRKNLYDHVNQLKSLQNSSVNMDSHRGSRFLLHFWKIDCKPCLKELPTLVNLMDSLSPSIKLVTINSDLDYREVAPFLKKKGWDFVTYYDLGAEYTQMVTGQRAVPITLYILEDGSVEHRWDGEQRWYEERHKDLILGIEK